MYALARDISAVTTDDGVVLLHKKTGDYWGLNQTGAIVLRAAVDSGRLSDAVDALVGEYPVTRDVAERDVAEVLDSLVSAGLLRPVSGAEA